MQLRPRTYVTIFVILTSSAFCGKSNSRKSGSSTNLASMIPAGWDGTTDWRGGSWIVADAVDPKAPAVQMHTTKKIRLPCIESIVSEKYAVKVRFFQGGALHRRVFSHRGLKSIELQPSPAISAAVLEFDSVADVESLAKISHSHRPGGCAAIELLAEPGSKVCAGDFSTTELTSFLPPVYDETIGLDDVALLINEVDQDNIVDRMKDLQDMGTRYFNSDNASGVSSQILNRFSSTAGVNLGNRFNVEFYQHSGIASSQPSVIASINGTTDGEGTVIIGAHLDSINPVNQSNAPGADDNASGIAILFETLRIIEQQNLEFRRNIELHAYAAEEIGLVGSQQIASAYSAAKKSVNAMMQLDMASFSSSGDTVIHLFRDDTATILRRSVKDLLTNYLGGNFTDEGISVAGTSDHRSWYKFGYPTVFPFEDTRSYNPKMHTDEDTVANANAPGLAKRMAQLVISFLAHHAGLEKSAAEYGSKLATMVRDDDIKVAVLGKNEVNVRSIQEKMAEDDTVVIFAVPEGITTVESCRTATGQNKQCGTDRLIGMEIGGGPAGRRFFYSVLSASEHNSSERVFGYTSENSPTHARSIYISENKL